MTEELQELYEKLAHTRDVANVKEALLGHREAFETAFDSVFVGEDAAGQPVRGSTVLLLETSRNIHTFVEAHLTYFDDRDVEPFRIAMSALEAATSGESDLELWEQGDAVRSCLHNLCEWIRNKSENLRSFLAVLRSIVEVRHLFDIDMLESTWVCSHDFKKPLSQAHEELISAVGAYLDSPWMQIPWLTNKFLLNILNLSQATVIVVAQSYVRSARSTANLRWPWGVLVPAALTLLFFIACSAVAGVLFLADLSWAGWVVVAFLIWHYVRRFIANRKIRAHEERYMRLARALGMVQFEVASECYDPEVLDRRLQQIAADDQCYPSVAHTLIRLAARPKLLVEATADKLSC